MSKQTAVQWLLKKIEEKNGTEFSSYYTEFIKQAKAMEKEQITKTARQCHFEGVRQSAKTSEEYIAYGEQYYNQTYGGTND
jgi:hypothetical protein